MAMERWEQIQRARGNTTAAEIARVLRDQYGDVSLQVQEAEAKATLTPEALVISEKEAWENFLGKEINVPQPPQELLDTLAHAQEQGITVFEAHYLPKVEFKKDSKYPGWQVKPQDWYWQQIKARKIAKDAAKLDGVWVLVDGSQKPNYQNGHQLYENDPIGQMLARARAEGKIASGDVPQISRFATSWDEIDKIINPAIAKLLGVSENQVRLPKEIEFNVLGNIFHPEWGQTNTWEWFNDRLEDDARLIGGNSGNGGLANVIYNWHDFRDGSIGFRPLVVFPSKS